MGIGQWDAALLMVISLCSFFGQTFLNRSFQIITAAKGSSIMCTQVLQAPPCAGTLHAWSSVDMAFVK